MTHCKAYLFCKEHIEKDTTPKYVKLQMKDFMAVCEGENDKYIVCSKKLSQLESILKILIMPKGLKAGQTLYDCTTGYQWLFYTAILCTVYRENTKRRRYETGLLENYWKNFKSFTYLNRKKYATPSTLEFYVNTTNNPRPRHPFFSVYALYCKITMLNFVRTIFRNINKT